MYFHVTSVNKMSPRGRTARSLCKRMPHYTIGAADFAFPNPADIPANSLASVKITQLQTAGSLKLNEMTYAGPGDHQAEHRCGATHVFARFERKWYGLCELRFAVMDNGGTSGGGVDTDQTPNSFTFDVTPVNDARGGEWWIPPVTVDEDAAPTVIDLALVLPGRRGWRHPDVHRRE